MQRVVSLVIAALFLFVTGPLGTDHAYGATALMPGDLVTVDWFRVAVAKVDPRTGMTTTVAAGPPMDTPGHVAISSGGNLYITGGYTESRTAIFRIDPRTDRVTVVAVSAFGNAAGMTVDTNGLLLVVDVAYDEIIKVDPDTGRRSVAASGGLLRNP